ncbi:hypothetical protein RYX36_005647 [Vicia faba]
MDVIVAEEGLDKAKEKMVFIYPNIALGDLSLFKMEVGGKLVEMVEEKGDMIEAVCCN